jgi:hypothetical protein
MIEDGRLFCAATGKTEKICHPRLERLLVAALSVYSPTSTPGPMRSPTGLHPFAREGRCGHSPTAVRLRRIFLASAIRLAPSAF